MARGKGHGKTDVTDAPASIVIRENLPFCQRSLEWTETCATLPLPRKGADHMSGQGRQFKKNSAVGFFLSAVFLGMTLWFNIAGLMSFIAETTLGWIVALVMWLFNGVLFTWVQIILTGRSMRDDDDEDDHHGGRRLRDLEADHAVVRVPVDKPRGPF